MIHFKHFKRILEDAFQKILARGGEDGGNVGRRAPLESDPRGQRECGRGDRGRYGGRGHPREECEEVAQEPPLHDRVLDARLGQAVDLELALPHRLGPRQIPLSPLLRLLHLCGLKYFILNSWSISKLIASLEKHPAFAHTVRTLCGLISSS